MRSTRCGWSVSKVDHAAGGARPPGWSRRGRRGPRRARAAPMHVSVRPCDLVGGGPSRRRARRDRRSLGARVVARNRSWVRVSRPRTCSTDAGSPAGPEAGGAVVRDRHPGQHRSVDGHLEEAGAPGRGRVVGHHAADDRQREAEAAACDAPTPRRPARRRGSSDRRSGTPARGTRRRVAGTIGGSELGGGRGQLAEAVEGHLQPAEGPAVAERSTGAGAT